MASSEWVWVSIESDEDINIIDGCVSTIAKENGERLTDHDCDWLWDGWSLPIFWLKSVWYHFFLQANVAENKDNIMGKCKKVSAWALRLQCMWTCSLKVDPLECTWMHYWEVDIFEIYLFK
jgi:hypothetical protein